MLKLLSRGETTPGQHQVPSGSSSGTSPLPTAAQNNANGATSEVEKIVLNGCSRLTDRSVAAISRKCPRLRHLEVRNCPGLTDQALVHLAHRCHDLEHLDLSGKNSKRIF